MLNRNIRCIEIHHFIEFLKFCIKLNRNIRCIEIYDDVVDEHGNEIVEPQHKMY